MPSPKILGVHKGYKQEWLSGEGSTAGRGHIHEGLRLEDGSGWVGIGHTLAEDGNKNEQVLSPSYYQLSICTFRFNISVLLTLICKMWQY